MGRPVKRTLKAGNEMTHFLSTWFWPLITGLALITALVNFGVAIAQRKYATVALVRGAAGSASLALAVFIIVAKNIRLHPPFALEWQEVFLAAGVFVFIMLWLPSQFERNSEAPKRTTLQERAARPVRATVRLQQTIPEDWMN
jgi:membrane protein implicated in regulation of membrane protease activity